MRSRPVRPNIYLPVVRFGVADSDWFTVLLISCALYLAPVPFGITLLYVPLQMWTWLLGTAGSIAFFSHPGNVAGAQQSQPGGTMELAIGYDELAAIRNRERETAILRRPLGRRRDSSIVGIYEDA